MDKALKLPLKQTRFGGKSKSVRRNVVLPVGTLRPANEPPDLSLQARLVWPQTRGFGGQVSKASGLCNPCFSRHDFAGRWGAILIYRDFRIAPGDAKLQLWVLSRHPPPRPVLDTKPSKPPEPLQNTPKPSKTIPRRILGGLGKVWGGFDWFFV